MLTQIMASLGFKILLLGVTP